MADHAHSTAASCVHPLIGSSAPSGAPTDFASLLGHLDAPRAAPSHPDTGLIELAGRVRALVERGHRAWDRYDTIEAAAHDRLPPPPEVQILPEPVVNENWRRDGSNGPLFDPPDFGERALAANAEREAALARRERLRTEIEERLGLPRLERRIGRMFRRLVRWAKGLTSMEPQTQAGLKAKAEAQLAVATTGSFDQWMQDLATSVSRDAVRLASHPELLPLAGRDHNLVRLVREYDESRERCRLLSQAIVSSDVDLTPVRLPDTTLLAASAEFHRIDALQLDLCARHHRDCEDIPGYAETEVAWRAALQCIADLPAVGWSGITAKAALLKWPSVWHDPVLCGHIADSMAEDVLRVGGRAWDMETTRVPGTPVFKAAHAAAMVREAA